VSRAEAVAQLEELHASLPALECKGRCHDTCTAIDASELERERGVELPEQSAPDQLRAIAASGQVPRCPALGPLNTCTVYDVRPSVCRAFGLVHDPQAQLLGATFKQPMMCDYGCVSDATMTTAEFWRIAAQIEALSRAATGVARLP
jgi:Fe-S-cluster containining protein